ncbi:hypothetical protein BKA69DRAFT_1169187 [Paraphysoderma sedebokerense]|nr:hypothetical protein BKA69DRAFT_1169187 [Paraphysoderma sedebokerense]
MDECAVKVNFISSLVSHDILRDLFLSLGNIHSLSLHPSPIAQGSQEAVIYFDDPSAAATALHLTGTQLADRTLVVTSFTAIKPKHPPPPPPDPVTQVPIVIPLGPRPAIVDPTKLEEIARTIYVGNITSSVSESELIQFFSSCGPVTYVKMAGDISQPTRFAFIEFATVAAANAAIALSGTVLQDKPLKINHSKNAINKAPTVPPSAAMKRVRESAQKIASKYGDSDNDYYDGDRRRDRSRDRDRDRRDRSWDRYDPRGTLVPVQGLVVVLTLAPAHDQEIDIAQGEAEDPRDHGLVRGKGNVKEGVGGPVVIEKETEKRIEQGHEIENEEKVVDVRVEIRKENENEIGSDMNETVPENENEMLSNDDQETQATPKSPISETPKSPSLPHPISPIRKPNASPQRDLEIQHDQESHNSESKSPILNGHHSTIEPTAPESKDSPNAEGHKSVEDLRAKVILSTKRKSESPTRQTETRKNEKNGGKEGESGIKKKEEVKGGERKKRRMLGDFSGGLDVTQS